MDNAKTSAKDFFLHLGAMVGLYTVTISFLNLVFRIINHAYPAVSQNYYYIASYSNGSELSLPVATLIIVFPLFIFLSYLVHKSYMQEPAKKELPVRKWLTYITLFVAGVILAGDLVMVLYKFLNGEDLTLGFLLKALSVFLVTALIFGFYLNDMREKLPDSRRKMWAIITSVVILVFIVLGFVVIGSPRTQRLLRYDDQKVQDLSNIQYQVINTWQISGQLPEKLDMPNDTQTNKPYEYRKTGPMSYELCAEFNLGSQPNVDKDTYVTTQRYLKTNDTWIHPAGHHCFPRTIDPINYPTQVRG